MAYGSTDGVSALLPAIGEPLNDSVPSIVQIMAWLAESSSAIDLALAGAGYSVPVATTATCYGEITALANLYAAAYALMARGLDTVQGTEENRSQTWLASFYTRLDRLLATPLSDVPLVTTPTTTRRRFRMTQIKRVDGYSAPYDDDTDMDS